MAFSVHRDILSLELVKLSILNYYYCCCYYYYYYYFYFMLLFFSICLKLTLKNKTHTSVYPRKRNSFLQNESQLKSTT